MILKHRSYDNNKTNYPQVYCNKLWAGLSVRVQVAILSTIPKNRRVAIDLD